MESNLYRYESKLFQFLTSLVKNHVVLSKLSIWNTVMRNLLISHNWTLFYSLIYTFIIIVKVKRDQIVWHCTFYRFFSVNRFNELSQISRFFSRVYSYKDQEYRSKNRGLAVIYRFAVLRVHCRRLLEIFILHYELKLLVLPGCCTDFLFFTSYFSLAFLCKS